MTKSRGFVALGAFIATVALAQPKPSPRLADLKPFAGTWRCAGRTLASQWGPEHPTKATINVVPVLGNLWLAVDYIEDKHALNPHPNAGKVHWGYDEQTKKFTGYAIDNHGGFSSVESAGWEGNTIVWSGTLHIAGMTLPTRDTFTKKRPTEIVHVGEAEIGGNWHKLDEETCRRK